MFQFTLCGLSQQDHERYVREIFQKKDSHSWKKDVKDYMSCLASLPCDVQQITHNLLILKLTAENWKLDPKVLMKGPSLHHLYEYITHDQISKLDAKLKSVYPGKTEIERRSAADRWYHKIGKIVLEKVKSNHPLEIMDTDLNLLEDDCYMCYG